ncbi:MAG: NnrS family protein [Pseudobdellovibrio sp.]|nr:NnrS family protein [Pseudobdellovibrio sp.]
MEPKNHDIEPYKILFPIGILCSVIGLSFWILFQSRMINFYPKESHGNLMYFGFLWTFIAGFLMTAVPKMMSSMAVTLAEISVAVSFSFLQIILTIRNETRLSSYLVLFQLLFLLFFLIRRFIISRKFPFAGFIFIPTALLLALSGAIIFITTGNRSLFLLLSGEAFVLNLILGLGSRLVPVISRLPNALLPHQNSNTKESFMSSIIFAILFNATYFMQALDLINLALIARTLIIAYALIKYFGLLKKPVKWTVVGVGLKITSTFLALGTLLSIPYFGYSLAGLHVLYIGGFVLITLLISTRVVLAHGGESLDYEISSKKVTAFIACLIMASLLRLLANTHSTSNLVLFSFLFFVAALVLWTIKMLKVETKNG